MSELPMLSTVTYRHFLHTKEEVREGDYDENFQRQHARAFMAELVRHLCWQCCMDNGPRVTDTTRQLYALSDPLWLDEPRTAMERMLALAEATDDCIPLSRRYGQAQSFFAMYAYALDRIESQNNGGVESSTAVGAPISGNGVGTVATPTTANAA